MLLVILFCAAYAYYYCYDRHRGLYHYDLSQLLSVESSFTYISSYEVDGENPAYKIMVGLPQSK